MIARVDLDRLLAALELQFVKLSECLVSPGWRLLLGPTDAPGIHYTLCGGGTLTVAGQPPIALEPHRLVIVPAGHALVVEGAGGAGARAGTVDGRGREFAPGALRRFEAGQGEPRLLVICGYFRARIGDTLDLFATLGAPIVEQFAPGEVPERALPAALGELMAQEAGAGAMSTALLQQVLVTILRRSLGSLDLWLERFAVLSDPQIARAFADMVARPGAPHTVRSLAQRAGLSRSAFMARFSGLFGRAPMVVLRQLRMRQAARLLASQRLSLDQVAAEAGYKSRSSFRRAFKKAGGREPD